MEAPLPKSDYTYIYAICIAQKDIKGLLYNIICIRTSRSRQNQVYSGTRHKDDEGIL